MLHIYHPHPSVGEGNVFSLFTPGEGDTPVRFPVPSPDPSSRSFLGGTPPSGPMSLWGLSQSWPGGTPVTGVPQKRGTAWTRTGIPPARTGYPLARTGLPPGQDWDTPWQRTGVSLSPGQGMSHAVSCRSTFLCIKVIAKLDFILLSAVSVQHFTFGQKQQNTLTQGLPIMIMLPQITQSNQLTAATKP